MTKTVRFLPSAYFKLLLSPYREWNLDSEHDDNAMRLPDWSRVPGAKDIFNNLS